MADIIPFAEINDLPASPFPALPPELNGNTGGNRAKTQSTILSAQDDRTAIASWIARSGDSDNTSASYIKEADRLYRWAVVARGKPLSSLTHEDMLLYERFLRNPLPADVWVSKRRCGRDNPAWKPFAGPLSAASVRQAMIIINSMFSWMVEAGYLAGNPLSLARRRKKGTVVRTRRLLSDRQWDAVRYIIKTLPQKTDRDVAHYHRCRWLFSLLYMLGARISEVVNAKMADAEYQEHRGEDGQVQGEWWITLIGKGNKERKVPFPPDLVEEFKTYRAHIEARSRLARNKDLPLVVPIFAGRSSQNLHRGTAHRIVKEITARASAFLQQEGFQEDADKLVAASAHWFRHTAGSRMADAGVDLRTIRDNFGHADISTTDIYTNELDSKRHKDTAKHRMSSTGSAF